MSANPPARYIKRGKVADGRDPNNLPREDPSMKRPSMIDIMMGTAHLVAMRSTCTRAMVGAVITTPGLKNIVAFGYNGNARGLSNTCDRTTPGNCGCLHAEENALIKAPYDQGDLVMVCTHAPCPACAKRVLNSRVTTVYFADPYTYFEPSQHILHKGGVALMQYDEVHVTVNIGDELEHPIGLPA